MMTGAEYLARCKADVCNTQSRSKNGQKYHNKYGELLGKLGYKGINSKGVHTKKYSYGVVGHCDEGAGYHLIKGGLPEFYPKSVAYINNTNTLANWLKKEPTIKGFGKVDWTTDITKARKGDLIFKGEKGSKSYSHTCIFDHYSNGKVYTCDFNVSGKKNGKTYNNGLVHSRKKSKYRWGIARMPFPVLYVVNTKNDALNVREEPNLDAKIVGKLKRGEKVYVTIVKNGWAYLPQLNKYCSVEYLKKV